MTEGPDPEKLLAEALRAQAASTPVAPTSAPAPAPAEAPQAEEPATTGTPADSAHLLDLFSGVNHGLLSGRDPDTEDVSYRGLPREPMTGPLRTTQLSTRRAPLAWWWIVLLALALGLACGAIAGVLSLV